MSIKIQAQRQQLMKIKQINLQKNCAISILKEFVIVKEFAQKFLQIRLGECQKYHLNNLKEKIESLNNQMAPLGSIEWKDNKNFVQNLTSPFRLTNAIYTQANEKIFIVYRDIKWNTEGRNTDQTEIIIIHQYIEFYNLPQGQILKACLILEKTSRRL